MHTALTTGTMRAIVQHRYGTAAEDVLELDEVARPAIGDDEVLVRVRAAGVDRGTWHLMAGTPYAMRVGFGLRGPKTQVPGIDLAGTVEAVGAGVTSFAPGDDVFGTGKGTFAEYAVAKAAKLATKPANLSFEQAAAVPVSATTALQAVGKARVEPGQRVLVIGASGGVGSFAVQIAKAYGTEVTGVASTAKLDSVRALGADHVVDYTVEDFLDGRLRYDAIVDIGGNRRISDLRRALEPGGTLVITGGEHGGRWFGGIGRNLAASVLSPFVSQRLRAFVTRQRASDLAVLRDLIESGSVTPAVDRTYPLADAAAAVSYVGEGRARGKVVVTV